MIATIVNCVAVIIGSLIGINVHNRIGERFKDIVFTGIGLIALVVGIQMSLEMKQVLYVALSLIIGGLLGDHWDVEGAIFRFGEWLRVLVTRRSETGRPAAASAGSGPATLSTGGSTAEEADGARDGASEGAAGAGTPPEGEQRGQFATGFLTSSVLFCAGAMTLIGSFQAGAQGNYTLILTKSVMDGFMSIMLAAAMGIGVMFSVIVILVYQGSLTILASLLGPVVNRLILSEIAGVGGILVITIGLNLLDIRKVKTANFLPALVLVVVFAVLDPYLRQIGALVPAL